MWPWVSLPPIHFYVPRNRMAHVTLRLQGVDRFMKMQRGPGFKEADMLI